jgi:DNA-binding MarR family transcriptional regulator
LFPTFDALEAARSLRSALAKLNRRLRAHDDSGGIGSTGLSLLGRLLRDGPSSAAALAAAERLKPQSLTRTLRTLEERELIARDADAADRRRSTITITPAGVDVLRRTARERERWLTETIEATLAPTERDVLRIATALLERLADADDPAET